MNTHNIEPAGALPQYDVKEMVVLTYEEDGREFVCEVTGHTRDEEELLYQLKEPITGDTFTVPLRFLLKHIEADPADEYDFESHDYDAQGFGCLEDYESFVGAL